MESKAREFEVLGTINLPRIVGMLENKEEKIKELKTKDRLNEAHIVSQQRNADQALNSFRKRLEMEGRTKVEAI